MTTQGPLKGCLKSEFFTGLSTFGDCSPQNGSKPSPNPKTVPWDTPTQGLLWNLFAGVRIYLTERID